MTQQQGNSIIATYMGLYACKKPPYEGWYRDPDFKHRVCGLTGLKYNFDWGELMPVVEKISKDFEHNKNFALYQKYLQETNGEDFLIFRLTKEETYKAVIEFIQWHNKQKGGKK